MIFSASPVPCDILTPCVASKYTAQSASDVMISTPHRHKPTMMSTDRSRQKDTIGTALKVS